MKQDQNPTQIFMVISNVLILVMLFVTISLVLKKNQSISQPAMPGSQSSEVVPVCPKTAEQAMLWFGEIPQELWKKTSESGGCGWSLEYSGERYFLRIPKGYVFEYWDKDAGASKTVEGPLYPYVTYGGVMWKRDF